MGLFQRAWIQASFIDKYDILVVPPFVFLKIFFRKDRRTFLGLVWKSQIIIFEETYVCKLDVIWVSSIWRLRFIQENLVQLDQH